MQDNYFRIAALDIFQKENLCYSDQRGVIMTPDFVLEREFYDSLILMYVIEGKFFNVQYGKVVYVNPGEYILVDLKEPHRYGFVPGSKNGKMRWIHINGNVVRLMASQIEKYCSFPVCGVLDSMEKDIMDCFDCFGELGEDKLRLSVKIYEIMLKIISQVSAQQKKPEEIQVQEFQDQALSIMDSAVYQAVDLDEIARQMHLSKYYFCRIFHELFGVPPMQYLAREKVEGAKYHLMYTDAPVSEIAQLFGYSSQAYFSRSFHRETGMTPSRFRKQARCGKSGLRGVIEKKE